LYVDEILESFNLDPLKDFDSFEYSYEDGNKFLTEAYTEATTGTTKKNIFQKLWDFIKKMFKWIAKAFSRMVNWIKSLFSRNKTKKTVDQVVEEVFGNKPFNGSKYPIKIKFPFNDKSTVKVSDVNVISKDLITKIDTSAKSITFIPTDINRESKRDRKIPSQGETFIGEDYKFDFLNLIRKPQAMEMLTQLAKMISQRSFDESFFALHKKFRDITRENLTDGFKDYEFTIDQLIEGQRRMNDILNAISETISMDNNENYDSKVIEVTNDLAYYIRKLQMGCNIVNNHVSGSFIIDKKYLDTVDTKENLAKFINKLIVYGVPGKYIGYNAYLISDKSLKGDGSKGNKENPIWGQSRLVFFPLKNDDEVIKIALSGWGVSSNKNEVILSKKFVEIGDQNRIAVTKESYENNTVVTAERTDTDGDMSNYTDYVQSNIANSMTRINDPKSTNKYGIYDIHKNNIGLKNGNPVLIDYGGLEITYTDVS
jgi:hypothetical protein